MTKQKLVLHMLTALPPHNVNRDEDGRPKTATLGGSLRGRISSQAKKRALRYSGHLPDGQRAIRTRELGIRMFRALTEPGEGKLDDVDAAWVALAVNHAIGAGDKAPDRAKAQEIVFPKKKKGDRDKRVEKLQGEMQLGADAAARRAIEEELGTEQGLVVSTQEKAAAEALVGRLRGAADKAAEAKTVVDELKLGGLLSRANRDLDLALFGRMVASLPGYNVEAAASVGHAITTHRFSVEADYFSAGEELNALKGTGAAITSYGFFGSGIYYQHAVLDYDHLVENLDGDRDLARQAVELFLRGLVCAQPKGKRNAFASDTAAIYVLARRTTSPTINLGFAFLDPVREKFPEGSDEPPERDLAKLSIQRLKEFDQAIAAAYGIDGEALALNCYPPARTTSSNTHPAGEVWTLRDLNAFAVQGLA